MEIIIKTLADELGKSVYSASKLAAEEFPQFDVNLRSAVSIARRLQDPLAELVKIDPKVIGVGQYQHDMPQKKLDEALSGVVEDCVNSVGVDLNTASPSLLQKVAGLTSTTAKNIVAYREEKGEFTSRKQLLKVSKLRPKAYEQSAGFLRISGASEILDNTGVHPESYDAAKHLLSICGLDVKNNDISGIKKIEKVLKETDIKKVAEECKVGVPTMKDIIRELLKPGMELKGTVRNVIDFGAFIDIGVHQDGLVHISEISDKFIRHPSELLSVGDVVDVSVISVDEKKNRISLTMKN